MKSAMETWKLTRIDEILKAAVSKYGLHQWSRVASLLARKSAKQAKARWNEYLDPRIRKLDWSVEEDEKLLTLAKLMPNQWRSIAESLGRTATQCLERYQRLLEDHDEEHADESEGAKPAADLSFSGPGIESMESIGANKNIEIGDVNLTAESREARPDAVDLDDDEQEMLAEARARLANTKGKKASRKQREKMLNDSKRIALLQKRRELKQAGITTKINAPKKKFSTQIDYNADIAYEHRPEEGLYDTTEEDELNSRVLEQFERTVNKIGLKDNDKAKKEKRKRDNTTDIEKNKNTIEKLAKLVRDGAAEDDVKRRKLELSAPKFAEEELKSFGKQSDGTSFKDAVEERNAITDNIDERISDTIVKIKENKVQQSALLSGSGAAEVEAKAEAEAETGTEQAKPAKKEKTRKKKKEVSIKVIIRNKFASLPPPKNDFEILDPDEEEEDYDEVIANLKESPASDVLTDHGEVERLTKLQEKEEQQKAALRRSQAVQKGLPIPNLEDVDGFLAINLKGKSNGPSEQLTAMVRTEMVKLMRSDYARARNIQEGTVRDLDDRSRHLVAQEMKQFINETELSSFQLQFEKLFNNKKHQNKFQLSDNEYNHLTEEIERLVLKSQELEEALDSKLEHLTKESQLLLGQSHELLNEIEKNEIRFNCFQMLLNNEQAAITSRISLLQSQVDEIVKAETAAKQRFFSLKSQVTQ